MVCVNSLSQVFIPVSQTTSRLPSFCSLSNRLNWAHILAGGSSVVSVLNQTINRGLNMLHELFSLSKGLKCENWFNRGHLKYRQLCCTTLLLNYKQIQNQMWRRKRWKKILTFDFWGELCGSPSKEGPYTPRRLFTRPYWFGSTPVRPAMLANAIDKPSVLSRSVEACSSFSKTNQGRREERGGKEGRGGTSMDSDGERGGGRRCKRSRETQTPVHGLGTLN